MSKNQFPIRGEIYWVNMDPAIGSEIKKKRPVLIISNNVGNQFSDRVVIVPITSNATKLFPFEVNEMVGFFISP